MKFQLMHLNKYIKKNGTSQLISHYHPTLNFLETIYVQDECVKELKNNHNNLKSYRELQESVLAPTYFT